MPEKIIYLESLATNGGENSRFSLDKIVEENLSHEEIILLSHATSLRRLDAVMKFTAKEKGFESRFQRAGTDYFFNPNNLLDQKESIAELLRIADWPAKGWCVPQDDLPEDLVQYARDIKDLF